jgi:uncharacterized protein YjbI with pentapeptide repeats
VCFDRADLSRARLSGANLVLASLEDAKAEMEFALMAHLVLQDACLGPDSLIAPAMQTAK